MLGYIRRTSVRSVSHGSDSAVCELHQAGNRAYRPSPRDRAERRFDEVWSVVAGKTEVDEPLPVDRPRHLLQHFDPPPVVLDQIVDRAETAHDAALYWNRRKMQLRNESLRAEPVCLTVAPVRLPQLHDRIGACRQIVEELAVDVRLVRSITSDVADCAGRPLARGTSAGRSKDRRMLSQDVIRPGRRHVSTSSEIARGVYASAFLETNVAACRLTRH